MALQDRLDAFKADFESGRFPALKPTKEMLDIMHRATEDLRKSGILDRIVKVGARMPSFALTNHDGRQVSSQELLARGPLVLSFFRGSW